MNDKISIIVPIYNSSASLNRCVDSLLNQTYSNLEILLIDDGSTDKSSKICDDYAKKDIRIKVYHKKNGGVSSARNLGLEKATGDYISFVDSDDFVENNMLEVLLNTLLKTKSNISISNLYYEDDKKNIIMNYSHKNFTFNKNEYPQNSYFITSISGYACNKLYSKKTIYCKQNDFIKFDEDISIAEDDLFNYRILENNNNIKYCYIDERLYHYVCNNYSAINRNFNEQKLTYFKAKEEEINILEKLNIQNDFLKADYIINQIRTKIIMKKLNVNDNLTFKNISEKSKHYLKNLIIKDLPFKLKIKFFVATKLTFLYKLKLINKFN